MNTTHQYKVDFVLVAKDRAEVQVVGQLIDDTGKVLGSTSDARFSVQIAEPEKRAKLVALVKDIAEEALRNDVMMDTPPYPIMPAQPAVVIDGKEIRPALVEVPAREATYKKRFEDGAVITW